MTCHNKITTYFTTRPVHMEQGVQSYFDKLYSTNKYYNSHQKHIYNSINVVKRR